MEKGIYWRIGGGRNYWRIDGGRYLFEDWLRERLLEIRWRIWGGKE